MNVEGGDIMVTVTEHVAVFDIDGEETVVFKRAHEVYGVYGSDIIATLIPGAEEGEQGVYSTSEMGKVTIAHYSDKKELYLKGSGTVLVWCGQSPLDDPFWGGASEGSGGGGGKGGKGFLGRTSTKIVDGSNVNPIKIDGEDVTAQNGDVVVYQKKEFIFDGTYWIEFGDTSGLGDLAYEDEADGKFTPAGTISTPTFTGTNATISMSGTPSGSVSVTPTTDTIKGITNVGTLPSCTYDSTTENLTFSAGTLPEADTEKTFMTGATASFSGDKLNVSAEYTPEGTISTPTFTGTEGTVTVS